MGQYLSIANSKLVDLITSNPSTCSSAVIISPSDLNDINLFLSVIDTTNLKTRWIKTIRKNLNLLTNVSNFELISAQIDSMFMENVFVSIMEDYKRVIQEIKDILERQEQLKASLTKQLDEDKKETKTHHHNRDQQHSDEKQSSSRSQMSIQLKSIEKNSSTTQKNHVNRRSRPYIRSIERQVENILGNFSSKNVSLKNVLPLLNQLIFDTVNVYDVRNVFTEFNKNFSKNLEDISPDQLTYLSSIGIYPNQKIRKLQKNQFTGQLISVFIFAHIDLHNNINVNKQLAYTSISFEFHPQIFKQMFNIIEQLTMITKEDFNTNLVYILVFCLRLFTTHLKILSSMTTNLRRYLLTTHEHIKKTDDVTSAASNKEFDLTGLVTDDELRVWLDTLLILVCNDQVKPEEVSICQEASKAIIYVLNQKATTFTDKLSFIFKYINENKHSILIEQLLNELNTSVSLLSWIEVLCDHDDTKSQSVTAFTVLSSLIDIYLNSPNDMRTQRIEQVLKTFQQLLFIRLASELGPTAPSLASKYLSYILTSSNGKLAFMNDILVGLCLLVETEKKFNFTTIQPIFTAVLPLLAEFAAQNTTNQEITYWLVGKMSRVLLAGTPPDLLEMKYIDKLQSSLFAGGCERISIENNQSSSDQEFLMSIYNSTDQGAQLISKMKLHMKDKRCLLQKSIEQQVNEACAALFAVYIKHYRRINLAKSELSQADDQKPHQKLLSIFEYAHRIQTIFAIRRGQGDDCNELYKQIKIKTRFLLVSVKESHLIPIITNVVVEQTSEERVLTLNEDMLHRAIDTYVSDNLTSDGSQSEVNELLQCMTRQFERATIRLITYRFAQTFIPKMFNIEDKNRIISFLAIYPFFLRNINLEWSFLENIPAINIELKEEIMNSYYSIIRTILSYLLQSPFAEQTILVRHTFSLLNLCYTSADIDCLHHYELLQLLFTSFVRSDQTFPPDVKIIGHHWFRLYVFKLCENFQMNQEFVFSKLIFNELNESVENAKTNDGSLKLDIELGSNQWLLLLLHCVYSYEHIRSLCATNEYIEKLLDIYRNSHNQTKILLALKILRRLILFLPESVNRNSKTMIKSLLNDILLSEKKTPDIFTELIYIYRSIITHKSPWQMMATQMIFDTISTSMKSLESNQMSNVLTALCILGGYIQPFCLGSVVQVYVNSEMDNETQLAVITEIDTNALDLTTTDARPYFVQYSEIDRTEWVSADRLRVEIDVPPPNLLALPIAMEDIYLLFDALAYFVQIDTSLELKRRSMAALYRILTSKQLVEIFLQKPYASIIVKLSTADLLSKHRQQPVDLRLWSKRHLEQYCLSLDRCESSQQIIEDTSVTSKVESSFTVWTDVSFRRDRATVDLLSTDVSECYQWKPNVSKKEIQVFKRGRIGQEEIRIVPMSIQLSDQWLIEDCGTIHRFPGRICLINETAETSMTTFIVDNLQLSEGKWYFCVRLLEGTCAQIGWATEGFKPNNTTGIGNDQYSWSYDGSQGMLYNNGQFSFLSDNVRWSTSDVCGCGIEIDSDQIRINYWLNGHFLGTAFAHKYPIGSTTTICDMLPNRRQSTYFPVISLKVNETLILSSCELIFSPEDMIECPLPKGYKPLLMPTLVNSDDSLVPYPYSAYLIGDQVQDYIYRARDDYSATFLRDFVNDHHLRTTMICDNHQLILPENSGGFLLTIDHHGSLTISFDFQILTKLGNSDIPLLTFDTPETFSVRIPSSKINQETHAAIVFQPDDRQMKIYINNECQTLDSPSISQFNIHLLPKMAVGIQNLAIWNYALSEELIRRLFTFGLSYIAMDYHKLNEYRKQANTLTFSDHQKCFANGSLVPLNEPFDENKWEEKKKQADQDESMYFKPITGTNQSAVQLFGNKTYLVLEKSIEPYSAYTLILDISIDNLPKTNEQVTLVTLNEQSEIFITHNAQLCLSFGNKTKMESKSKLKLNEFIRLLISVDEKSMKLYVNGLLELHVNVDSNDQLMIKDKKIELFKEHDLTKNTTSDDTLRIECKSITHLNRATKIITNQMKSPNTSLENLVATPYSIVAPSLIRIGYDESKIKSALIQKPTGNIQALDTILRENISWKFGRAIDKEKLKDLLRISEFDTDEKITNLADTMLGHWNEIHQTPSPSTGNPWFSQAVHHLNIDDSLIEWIQDKTSTIEGTDPIYELLDLNQLARDTEDQRKKIQKSIQYSHQQIPHQRYSHSRLTCEHGLISMYAHYTILNMLRVWSNDGSSLFPLEKFGDCTLIVTLVRLLDYHYNYTRLHTDENVDRMSLLINAILKVETNELLKHQSITQEMLPEKAPILYRLQMSIIVQSIQLLSNPSLLSCDYSDQSMIKQPNLNFILKLVHLFVKLIHDTSTIKQHDVDFLVPILFPVPLINLLFDLFLIGPTHQSKTNILHLFSTLMQTSDHFNLSRHIQHFLFRLFIELSSNPTLTNSQTMKTFQSVLLDLIYLLFGKEKKNGTIQLIGFNFPASFHHILMTIDVINALTDQTKQTSFPEQFLLQSSVLLGEDLPLMKDQIEKSNTHFDATADLQLMNYMNNHPLIEFSVIELINSLPTESLPNPTYYKNYPSLWHIPAIYIQTRAKLFYLFTTCLEKLLTIIDFSLLPGQSLLTDKIRTAKGYILYPTKLQLLNTTLEMTSLQSEDDIPSINFDTVQASISNDHDLHTMFYQAYEQLHDNAHVTFRQSTSQLWRAQYLAMHSTDQGGPYRDSISCMCSDLSSTRLSLFILCPNGRTNSGLNRDRWIPNVYPVNQPISNQVKKQYRFVGQLIGMAIRKRHYLDLKFPTLLWKQLVREAVTIEDIEAIDVQSFTMINEIEKTSNDLLSSVLDDLRFEVMSSTGQTYELISGGKDIPITGSNFKEYCASYRDYRLNEFYRQIEFIRQGLYSVVPGYFLGLFTADELEEAVCGKGNIDVELLKRNTAYGGDYNQDSLGIRRFWIILREMFTEEQKKLFLKFVWGRCTLPSCDDDFISTFRINSYHVFNGSVDGALPRSHTCSFALDLPDYSSIDIMYDRLNYAITYCSSIDGDGNMNEADVLTDFD